MPNSRGPISAEHAAWLVAVGYSSGNFDVSKETAADIGYVEYGDEDDDKGKEKDEDEYKDEDKNKDDHQVADPPKKKKMFFEMPWPIQVSLPSSRVWTVQRIISNV